MAGKTTFAILDHSNETGTVSFWHSDLDAGNVDAYVNDGVGGALGDMRLALNALISGNHLRRTVTGTIISDTATIPGDSGAQRERKAQVNYRDTVTGKLYRLEIPTFNMTGAQAGTDVIDTSGPEWQAFITEFEANYTSELENAVQVVQVRHVGRSV
jgi:hypothetical protein